MLHEPILIPAHSRQPNLVHQAPPLNLIRCSELRKGGLSKSFLYLFLNYKNILTWACYDKPAIQSFIQTAFQSRMNIANSTSSCIPLTIYIDIHFSFLEQHYQCLFPFSCVSWCWVFHSFFITFRRIIWLWCSLGFFFFLNCLKRG